jgi:predicted dehydrogenase
MDLEKKSTDAKNFSRRDFLKAAGATAAGLAVTSVAKSPVYAVAPARVIGANDRINIGHIGVGGMGGGHVNMVKEQPAEVNVKSIAVCDVFDKRALANANHAGLPASMAFRDYKKVLEIKGLDAVIIGTPEHWHAPIAIAAMEQGIHCYIEKPMCRTLKETEQLLETAKRTKCVVQVGSQGCSDAKWHTAGEQIKKGKIGKVVLSQGGYCRNNPSGEWNYGIDGDAKPGVNLDWDAWLGKTGKKIAWNPEHYFRWRKYRRYSAGILSDLFPHRLHPLMIACGADYPTQVMTVGSIIATPDRDVADTTQCLVQFPNGSQMILIGSTVNETGPEDLIRGTKADIYFGGGKVQIRPQRPFVDEIDQEDVEIVGPGENQSEHQRNWFHCIRTGETPNCNIDLAAKVQTVVCLAEMAWLQGKTMNFDPIKKKIV